MIKLIATDLDGTLFYPKRRLFVMPHANKKLLREFLADGGKVLMVSGRSIGVFKRVEKMLQHPIGLFGCNGAYFYDDSGVHDTMPLDPKSVLDFYAFFRNSYSIAAWFIFDDTPVLHLAFHDLDSFVRNSIILGNLAGGGQCVCKGLGPGICCGFAPAAVLVDVEPHRHDQEHCQQQHPLPRCPPGSPAICEGHQQGLPFCR